jgi:CheY-like chemotaxis protein
MQLYRYKTALIIDDDEVDQIILTSLIRNIFLAQNTLTYNSSKDALEFLAEMSAFGHKLPELIFLDLKVPLTNEFDFLDRLHEFPSSVLTETKIIVLSCSVNDEEIEKIKAYKIIHSFIYKPLTPEALKQFI